jgi:hypothetical protein
MRWPLAVEAARAATSGRPHRKLRSARSAMSAQRPKACPLNAVTAPIAAREREAAA